MSREVFGVWDLIGEWYYDSDGRIDAFYQEAREANARFAEEQRRAAEIAAQKEDDAAAAKKAAKKERQKMDKKGKKAEKKQFGRVIG